MEYSAIRKYEIVHGVYSVYSLQDLKSRFSNIDLIAIDLDECVFPGYSQTILGAFIFFNIFFMPYKLKDWKYIYQLINGGLFITFTKIKTLFNINAGNIDLIDKYEKTMKGIPQIYFDKMARFIPRLSYIFSYSAVRDLSKKAPVGIVSFGLNVILDEYVRQFGKEDKSYISFYDSNTICFQGGKFAGYLRSQLKTDKFDKKATLESKFSEYKARCPLVIGHNEDDLEMVKYAQENGGIGIGFNPKKAFEKYYDVVIKSWTWMPIYKLVKLLSQ